MKNVFITGISGCVGSYLADLILGNPEYKLFLLVSNPHKLSFDPAKYPNVAIVHDEMMNIKKYSDLLKGMDHVIHIAAGWGTSEINFEYTIDLFNALDPARIKKVIYFSTASILGPDNKVNDKVGEIGTSYIKGKYDCHKKLPELPVYDKIVTLFPTWVLGGDASHRYSHAMGGLLGAKKWLWLLRFLSIDFEFHFIHAKDIAFVVKYILENELKKRELVLGNGPVTADQLIQAICDHYKVKRYFKIRISPKLVKRLAGNRISEWDKYCLDQRHFVYKVSNPRTFGITAEFPTITNVLGGLN
ncbi:MAG: NAD(P)-dependent oxidoreductase [Candidatus Margulisiibacteriota bacterium]|nr:NAD(P)-dependent oxidoreductase [Candidatus Margulisiibacteriota bacterium]